MWLSWDQTDATAKAFLKVNHKVKNYWTYVDYRLAEIRQTNAHLSPEARKLAINQ